MKPLAQKKKKDIRSVVFHHEKSYLRYGCQLWSVVGFFCRPVISRVRGVSHHFSLHAKVGGVHFMFCVNNVLPQGGKEIH